MSKYINLKMLILRSKLFGNYCALYQTKRSDRNFGTLKCVTQMGLLLMHILYILKIY